MITGEDIRTMSWDIWASTFTVHLKDKSMDDVIVRKKDNTLWEICKQYMESHKAGAVYYPDLKIIIFGGKE
jgi:hypothetical protein